MNFIDDAAPLANVRETPEGYLIAEAFVARTGIQRYLGSEVGRPDLPFVDVYRPEAEVFKKESVSSFAHKPITVDHPSGGVQADTWKDLAVGEVSTEAMRDGERLKLQIVVKDAAAVKGVKTGDRRQLSPGYTCELVWADGVAPNGQHYQATQTKIDINHLAIVARGRAGNCAIGDSAPWGIVPIADNEGAPPRNPKEVPMDTKPVVLGDKAVQVLAADAAAAEAFVAALNKQVTDASTLVQTKDGEIAVLKQKLADAEMTPEKLAKLVADRAIVANGYKALTGKDAVSTLSDADLRREAVVAKLGDSAKTMSDAEISGAFQAYIADGVKTDPIRQAVAGGLRTQDATADMAGAVLVASGLTLKKEA